MPIEQGNFKTTPVDPKKGGSVFGTDNTATQSKGWNEQKTDGTTFRGTNMKDDAFNAQSGSSKDDFHQLERLFHQQSEEGTTGTFFSEEDF